MRVPLLSLSYLRADLGGGAILGPLQALLPPQPNSGFSVAFRHGLPCGLLPWPFQVTFFTAFSMTFSCCSQWVQCPCARLLCLHIEKAPLPSCMELWWLRFPNGFLMRLSHFLTAGTDEDCSPGLSIAVSPDVGQGILVPASFTF